MKKWIALMLALIAALSLMTGCRTKTLETDENTTTRGALLSQADAPALPDTLDYGEDGVPTIIVYDVAERDYKRLNIEDYVMGVLAGEMRNDWPMEALKAQAILARTFVLKFISEKTVQIRRRGHIDRHFRGAGLRRPIRSTSALRRPSARRSGHGAQRRRRAALRLVPRALRRQDRAGPSRALTMIRRTRPICASSSPPIPTARPPR